MPMRVSMRVLTRSLCCPFDGESGRGSGNHEGVPVDQFPPRSVTGVIRFVRSTWLENLLTLLFLRCRARDAAEEEYSSGWLYETLADQWSRWLPESALEQLRFSGSFSVLLEPVRACAACQTRRRRRANGILAWLTLTLQGLRAISVNDEGCSSNNFWMRMKKETGCCKNEYADPGTLRGLKSRTLPLWSALLTGCSDVCGDGGFADNVLHWLVEELQAAEDAGERVLMLRHVPNSSRYVTKRCDHRGYCLRADVPPRPTPRGGVTPGATARGRSTTTRS